jgi:hypothetical protein
MRNTGIDLSRTRRRRRKSRWDDLLLPAVGQKAKLLVRGVDFPGKWSHNVVKAVLADWAGRRDLKLMTRIVWTHPDTDAESDHTDDSGARLPYGILVQLKKARGSRRATEESSSRGEELERAS